MLYSVYHQFSFPCEMFPCRIIVDGSSGPGRWSFYSAALSDLVPDCTLHLVSHAGQMWLGEMDYGGYVLMILALTQVFFQSGWSLNNWTSTLRRY